MRKNGVRSLLMGGQACVFYGAAEFSRDLDLVILLNDANLRCLGLAFEALDAEPIAVPELNQASLARGHAVHFRCRLPGLDSLRIDLMSNLRGVPAFETLWSRRVTIEVEGEPVELLSLPDLVLAKKTQRDKDWPMIRRLVEQDYYSSSSPTPQQVDFWLAELRSPDILLPLVSQFPERAKLTARRAVLAAVRRDREAIESALDDEQKAERLADRLYWAPLKAELEQLRMRRTREQPKLEDPLP
jgi:hypothetical protein